MGEGAEMGVGAQASLSLTHNRAEEQLWFTVQDGGWDGTDPLLWGERGRGGPSSLPMGVSGSSLAHPDTTPPAARKTLETCPSVHIDPLRVAGFPPSRSKGRP